MNEKEELSKILKKYDAKTVELYHKITKMEREYSNIFKRVEIRNKIKDLIMEESQ